VKDKKTTAKKVLIYTTIQPVSFIASKISGKFADVKALIPPGKSPHSFSPSPADIGKMQKADIYFTTGMPFEHNVLEKVLKGAKIRFVDVSQGITRLPVQSSCCDHEHQHNDQQKHTDSELLDQHIWLSPPNDIIIAKNILKSLCKKFPQQKSYFELNCKNLVTSLENLDKRLAAKLAPFKGETFFVYHPAFGYFAKHYGLKQEAVELEGKSPSPRHLQEIIKKAQAKNVRILFVQPQFSRKCAKVIAKAINGRVVKLDPLEYNILNNFNKIASALRNVFKEEKKQ
jgi:zinc transport system substrate-binding protein